MTKKNAETTGASLIKDMNCLFTEAPNSVMESVMDRQKKRADKWI